MALHDYPWIRRASPPSVDSCSSAATGSAGTEKLESRRRTLAIANASTAGPLISEQEYEAREMITIGFKNSKQPGGYTITTTP